MYLVLFSWFLLKTLASWRLGRSSPGTCSCARSPSYFHSHVNSHPSNLNTMHYFTPIVFSCERKLMPTVCVCEKRWLAPPFQLSLLTRNMAKVYTFYFSDYKIVVLSHPGYSTQSDTKAAFVETLHTRLVTLRFVHARLCVRVPRCLLKSDPRPSRRGGEVRELLLVGETGSILYVVLLYWLYPRALINTC